MILIDRVQDIKEIGGKAYKLLSLQIKNTPPLVVCPVSYFDRVEADPSLREELAAELQKRLKKGKKYAVRSSAVDEDSDKASFAGIHDSFLNIEKKDVIEYIEKVYKSAFTERAISYRRAKGLSCAPKDIKIAVVIQEMVDAEAAGVVNTVNPVTDNPDEIVISVAKGLGDKIVDGSESGTVYTVNQGNVRVEGEDFLSRKAIQKILFMAAEVARRTDSFQDIEFAYKDGRVYFLQARAITTYRNIDPHKRDLLIDNSNIIESYFGVTSYLTYTFAKDVYRDVYRATLQCGKVRKKIIDALSPSLCEMLYYYEGKIYYNMKSWYHVTSVFPFKKSTSYMENMMGVKSKTDDFKRVKLNLFDMMKLGALFLHKLRHIEELSDKFEENFNRIVLPYYGKKLSGSNEELVSLFKSIERDIVGEFTVPIINDCAVMIYFGLLKERAEKLKIPAEELNRYISNGGNVQSAGSAKELIRIVEAIKADPNILRDFKTLDEGALCKKYGHASPISEQIQEYIRFYGSRVPDELKLETVTMIEDERLFYRLVKDGLSAPSGQAEREERNVPKKIGRLTAKTGKFLKNRERLRLKRTYVYSVVRNIFLAFGENYKKEGRLQEVRDIFYLSKQEVLSGEGNFSELVTKRKAQEREYLARPIYDRVVFFDGVPMPVKNGAQGKGLHGIPGGSGKVRAKVSLMNSPSDKLTAGNIILTKRTDPGWISLFPLAGGLIVEHGSMLSHSFVVARELNLPAVVGVANATALIKDGDTVLLDGLKGEITVEN